MTQNGVGTVSGGLRPARPLRQLARGAIEGTTGTLPFFEYRLEATRWRQARQLRRREDAEVSALRARCGSIPEVDVATIIPTHRRPEMLRVAVDSALAQTVTDHHVVVIDDGAGELGNLPAHPRLTVMSLTRNIGVAGVVRNVGIRLSRSRLIAFLDDDNTWEPHHLECALRSHAAGAELTYSSLQRVDENGESVDVLDEPFDRRAMRERSLVDTNVLVIRRGPEVMFSRTPRRRGDFPLEDWEIVWRLSRRMRVEHLPEVTVRYVQHGGSHYSEWGTDAE